MYIKNIFCGLSHFIVDRVYKNTREVEWLSVLHKHSFYNQLKLIVLNG